MCIVGKKIAKSKEKCQKCAEKSIELWNLKKKMLKKQKALESAENWWSMQKNSSVCII